MHPSTLYKGYQAQLAACKTARQHMLVTAWEIEETECFIIFLNAIHANNEDQLKLTDDQLHAFRNLFSERDCVDANDDQDYLQVVYEDECKILKIVASQAEHVAKVLGSCVSKAFQHGVGVSRLSSLQPGFVGDDSVDKASVESGADGSRSPTAGRVPDDDNNPIYLGTPDNLGIHPKASCVATAIIVIDMPFALPQVKPQFQNLLKDLVSTLPMCLRTHRSIFLTNNCSLWKCLTSIHISDSTPLVHIISTGYTNLLSNTGYTNSLSNAGYTNSLSSAGYTNSLSSANHTNSLSVASYSAQSSSQSLSGTQSPRAALSSHLIGPIPHWLGGDADTAHTLTHNPILDEILVSNVIHTLGLAKVSVVDREQVYSHLQDLIKGTIFTSDAITSKSEDQSRLIRDMIKASAPSIPSLRRSGPSVFDDDDNCVTKHGDGI
ncbi:hypothetical protein BDR06DRAFT_976993 [Suillus hirtellus]|nr:hypothetical protein BDR06DRAFT_976993 [Suillus hirtellus]